jgi:methyl-accepting chemotaxis protein
MDSTLTWIIGLSVIAVVVLLAVGIMELKSTARTLRGFVETAEHSLNPTLVQMQETLSSMKKVADNMTKVTEDVKTLSGSAREIGQNVQRLTETMRSVTGVVDNIASMANTEASGLKAGVRVGFQVLLKSLIQGVGKE